LRRWYYSIVKLPALKGRGFPDRNESPFIALLGPALKARGAARALPAKEQKENKVTKVYTFHSSGRGQRSATRGKDFGLRESSTNATLEMKAEGDNCTRKSDYLGDG